MDDEPAVLEALERLLRKDFVVAKASSAEEALRLLAHTKDFAVVLSDYRMPGASGIELLRTVRQLNPTAVRAILSGQMDSHDIEQAINSAEIHRFILKPWDNEYLRIQMLEAIQSHIRLEEQDRLKVQAVTDPVTGLTNHRYFQQTLKDYFAENFHDLNPLSVVMIDVDHFKSFNDRHGHPEGDRLLRAIADRLQLLCSKHGTVSRYGGEEFAIILPHSSPENSQQLAELIRNDINANPFAGPHGRPAYVTISLGVATSPDHGLCAEDLIAAADSALYQAKHRGRNQTQIAFAVKTP